MAKLCDIKLENIDPEDIGDVLVRLEKSFRIKFSNTAFKEATTFGDICDIIEAHINYAHEESCTTQQAFYRLRKAISKTLQIDERVIKLDSELGDLFTRDKRRQQLKDLQDHLNVKIDILEMKEWLFWVLFSGVVLSLIALFFDWRLAVIGLFFFILCSKVASLFSKELEIRTVQQLSKKLTRDNYLAIRRNPETINRNEIFKTIQDTFSSDLDLDKCLLTRDAPLGGS
jgi:hypothetical protein